MMLYCMVQILNSTVLVCEALGTKGKKAPAMLIIQEGILPEKFYFAVVLQES